MNKFIITNTLVNNSIKAMFDSIDNMDDINYLKKELKKHLRREFVLDSKLKEKSEIIDEAIDHLNESIDYFLSEKEIAENDVKVIHMRTIRERYLKPVLKILERGKDE